MSFISIFPIKSRKTPICIRNWLRIKTDDALVLRFKKLKTPENTVLLENTLKLSCTGTRIPFLYDKDVEEDVFTLPRGVLVELGINSIESNIPAHAFIERSLPEQEFLIYIY